MDSNRLNIPLSTVQLSVSSSNASAQQRTYQNYSDETNSNMDDNSDECLCCLKVTCQILCCCFCLLLKAWLNSNTWHWKKKVFHPQWLVIWFRFNYLSSQIRIIFFSHDDKGCLQMYLRMLQDYIRNWLLLLCFFFLSPWHCHISFVPTRHEKKPYTTDRWNQLISWLHLEYIHSFIPILPKMAMINLYKSLEILDTITFSS
jgi:hypothetical protein